MNNINEQQICNKIHNILFQDNMDSKLFSEGIRCEMYGDSDRFTVEYGITKFNTIIGGIIGTIDLNGRNFVACIPDKITIKVLDEDTMIKTIVKEIYKRLNKIKDGTTYQGCFIDSLYVDGNVAIFKVGIATW
jgi:hypothetical protein